MKNSVKREITGDTGLIPECDIPVGSEHTDTVEKNRFGVAHNSQNCYTFSALLLFGVCECVKNYIVLDISDDFNLHIFMLY